MAEYNEKMIDNAIGVLRNNDACVLSALTVATVVGMLEDYKRIKTECIGLDRAVREANSRADARWIPCSERMPFEPGVHVLVTDGLHIMESWYEVIDGELLWVDNYTMYVNINFGEVTHWMPIPELPLKGAE